MKTPTLLAIALTLLKLLPMLSAQSLWNPARPVPGLTSDTTARGIGDLLTVIISEKQVIKNKEQTQLSKELETDASIQNFDFLQNAFGTLPAVKASSSRDFSSDGKYDKEGAFQTRLSVLVIDVMPNGNLVIEGRRNVQTDRETKTIRVTGVVRPFDVTASNTVLSELIANASIAYEGEGPLTRNSNRGWLSELIDFVWPF